MATPRLTLRKALEADRLDHFIRQQETEDVGPVDERELMDTIKRTIKPPRSEDRTSRSPLRDGSTGK